MISEPRIILQVDDDANDVFFFQRAMKKAGVTDPIHVACDGQQAIDYLNGTGKFADRLKFPLPALILLDLKLPHVMGLNVLKWIREQPGERRIVIVLSSSADQRDIHAAYRLGANGFLTKPSETSRLEELARAIKVFWLTFNSPPSEDPSEEEANILSGCDKPALSALSGSPMKDRSATLLLAATSIRSTSSAEAISPRYSI